MVSKKPLIKSFRKRLALGVFLPIGLLLPLLFYATPFSWEYVFLGSLLMLFCGFWYWTLSEEVKHRLRTLSILLEATINQDLMNQGRLDEWDEEYNYLVTQINGITHQLKEHAHTSETKTRLLEKILSEISIAILILDENQTIVMANPKSVEFFKQPQETLLALDFSQLKISVDLEDKTHMIHQSPTGQVGRWRLVIESFYDRGKRHRILMFFDITQPLRQQELQAWQNLVRVLSHEINNSLTPIQTIAQTLDHVTEKVVAPESQGVFHQGLQMIDERSEHLNQFIRNYAQVAHPLVPKFIETSIDSLIQHVRQLYSQQSFQLNGTFQQRLAIDPILIQQVLINLVKNAMESMEGSQGPIHITEKASDSLYELIICDEGKGIAELENLFVPFFTTKPQGSGIGLVLCQQIMEAHQGSIMLENRKGACGGQATLRFPLSHFFSFPK